MMQFKCRLKDKDKNESWLDVQCDGSNKSGNLSLPAEFSHRIGSVNKQKLN